MSKELTIGAPLQLKNEVVKAEVKGKSLFPLVSASTMTDKPVQIEWLVENFLEQGSLNLLFGEPASGKSLFALDWAFCMTAGMDWHGYQTKQIDVVIIAGEGFAGMKRRLKALEGKYQMKAPANLFISKEPAQLMDEHNAQLVANSIKAICANPGLVIIDTLHRNMEGDENSSKDIGKFINNLDIYMKPLGAAILVVHHSGHGNKDRSRGSSSIRAAMDAEFSVKKDSSGIISLTCHKAKDFEALDPLQFMLKPVELEWLDSDAKPMNSVYLEPKSEANTNTKKGKLSARDEAILASLSDAILEHGVEPTAEIKAEYKCFDSPIGKMQKVVNIEHWKEKAYQVIVAADIGDAKRMAFRRCRDKLLKQDIIVEYDNYVWRVFKPK